MSKEEKKKQIRAWRNLNLFGLGIQRFFQTFFRFYIISPRLCVLTRPYSNSEVDIISEFFRIPKILLDNPNYRMFLNSFNYSHYSFINSRLFYNHLYS